MARQSKLPKALQPMLATLVDAPFDDRDWVFESKCDGFRIVAAIEKRSVTLYSRNGLIVSDNYVPIAKALEKVKSDAVIDGELVAIDERRKISMPRSAMIGRTTRCQDRAISADFRAACGPLTEATRTLRICAGTTLLCSRITSANDAA